MSSTLNLPQTATALRTLSKNPFMLGQVCAQLLRAVPLLVSKHLDHGYDHKSTQLNCIISTEEFTAIIDNHLSHFRAKDDILTAFPDDLLVDRKKRAYRRKWQRRYSENIEDMFKHSLRRELISVLGSYDVEKTREFNRGADKILSGIQWRRYPSVNVVLEAGDADWTVWIRKRCEELGMAYARKGESALRDI